MVLARHALLFAVGMFGAALVWSCGGKVEAGPWTEPDGGVGGGVVNKGGAAGNAGKGGQGHGGQGWGGQGIGGQSTGGQGWGGQGTGGQGWGGQGTGGQGWGGQGAGGSGGSTYGMIETIKFDTPFLLDADKMYDNNYIQQHGDAILYQSAFYGYYGNTSKPIPPNGGTEIAYGAHSPASGQYPATVQVMQYSVTQQNTIINPLVELYFASDQIQVGQLEVGFSPAASAYLILYNEINNGQDYCAIAVAQGYIQIATATNTTAADGGKLQFDGVNLPLYYPKETPWGDVSQYLGTVCPKE